MSDPLNRRALNLCLLAALLGGLATTPFMLSLGAPFPLAAASGFFIGGIISGILTWHELVFHRNYLKRLPLGAALCVSALIYFAVMVIWISVGAFVFGLAPEPFSASGLAAFWNDPLAKRGLVFGVVLSLVASSVSLFARLLGGRVLINLLLGRYHQPFEEERIFLFMDLTGSTAIAEEMGHARFIALLDDFFTDAARAVTLTQGEIYKYAGDEIIVSWPRDKGLAKGRCLRCALYLKDRLDDRQAHYRQRHGLSPRFKAALHGGTVVTGEIGYFRLEVAHLGDVLNTTARILEQCRELGCDYLVSEAVALAGPAPEDLTLTPAGEFSLRGKEQTVYLYHVAKSAQGR